MATVYQAEQLSLKRQVALKMLSCGEDENWLTRIQTEAESIAQLQNANVVQIYEIGNHYGRPYLALEYVEGGTLEQRIANTPPSERESAEPIELLARVIHGDQKKGIVHRDIKPANVLITTNGAPKISDFGLASWSASDGDRTKAGEISGTPHYMSPEQAAGSTDICPKSDLFALGAVLYELLMGQPPFRGDTIRDTLHRIRNCDPSPLHRSNPKVHRDLESICLKCLQKVLRHRYHSAEELANDLRRQRA